MARSPERGRVPGLYGHAVEFTCWTDEAAPVPGRELNARECGRVEERARRVSRWCRRYLGEVPQPAPDARALDAIWAGWLGDRDAGRPALDDTVEVLAAAFGEFLRAELAMDWIEILDGSGSAWAVRSQDGRLTVCPEWVIRKRISTRDARPFGDVFAFVRSEIERGRGLRV